MRSFSPFLSFQNIDFPDLTIDQQKKLCLTVQCRVELFHSNVCNGVEKGWPKRMFKKPDFQALGPKEKRCIYRDMERKAVFLYNKYVDEDRLAKRRRRRTNNTLAPILELIYRRNRFLRLKALGEPEPGYDAIVSESSMVADSEDENADLSLQTVINTGNTGTQKSNADRITDLNDNDCSSNAISENDQHGIENGVQRSGEWESKSTYTITQNFTIEEIAELHDNILIVGSECNVSSNSNEDALSEVISDDVVSSSQDTQSQGQRVDEQMPDMRSQDLLLGTPLIKSAARRRSALFDPDMDEDIDDEPNVDSLDFLSQCMTGQTSTQQQRQ